jgi:glycerol-3-phosphate acyltransferase PlsY
MEISPYLPASASEWLAVLGSYLLGSLPFGLLLGFLVKGVDIRKSGSGNIGATNAGRVLGRPYAYLAFAGDFGKGWLPCWLGLQIAGEPVRAFPLAVLCGAAAVAGHVWPIYLRFKGGKAVATGCGVVVALDPIVFLGGGAVWGLCSLLFRFVGLSSIAMVASFPLFFWYRMDTRGYGVETVIGTALLALLVIHRHRANIARMFAGTEPRMGRDD